MRYCLYLVLFALLRLAWPAPAQPRADAEATRLTRLGDFMQHLQWSPDGSKFLVTRIHAGKMALWTMKVDGTDLQKLLAGDALPNFDGHWSPDSKRIVFVLDKLQGTDGKLQIDVIDADGKNQKNLVPNQGFEEAPRWSPDGKQIAWTSTRDKNQDIWVVGADGKTPQRLTSDPAADNNPTWSPDGTQIAFCSGRGGNLDIWRMQSDGSGVRRLTNHPRMDYWPAWSPDGKRIAFTSNRDGNYDIYVMDADGRNPHNVTNHPAQDNFAAWSPDGRRLAFISNRGGGYDIYVQEVPYIR